MNITIYHNPRCSKSRACLALLEEKGLDFEIINYLKTPLSILELEVLVSKLGISPKDLTITKETIFKENYKDKNDCVCLNCKDKHIFHDRVAKK